MEKNIKAIRDALSSALQVCSRPCDECLFSKNKLVSDQRAGEILEQCEEERTHFICHKGTLAGKNIVCNGFYREKTTPYLELMKATGKIELIDPFDLQADEENKVGKDKKIRNKGKGV